MSKRPFELRKEKVDNVFRLLGFESMSQAQEYSKRLNFEYSHKKMMEITAKLKKEKVKKSLSDAVLMILEGICLEDISNEHALEPKFRKMETSFEEYEETGQRYVMVARDWQAYYDFLERDLEARCEKIV